MNAKEIDENKVSRIKWWLGSLRVKARVFIPEKVLPCLDLERYHLSFNKGYWGLNTCGRLIGGLHGRIVWVSFSGTWSNLWHLQRIFGGCSTSLLAAYCPRQLWPYRTWSASYSRTTNMVGTFVLFNMLLSYLDWFTIWSTS